MHLTPTPDQAHYSGLVDAQTADLARYLDLNAGLARVEIDPDFTVPHIDAEARRREVQNAYLDRVDGRIRTVFTLAGVIALATVIGGIVQTIGGVL